MSESVAAERTPAVIALEIRTIHSQTQRVVLAGIIEIGRRLIEAKALLPFGEWGDWLRDNIGYSQSTAQNYMRIFEEYGADQVNFFGEAKSQALGDLSYSKALKLLAVPAEEREEFAEENHVEELSSRELDKLIRERDEAMKAAEVAKQDAEGAALRISDLEAALEEEKEEARSLDAACRSVEEEYQALLKKPIDVAVQEPDPAVIDKARAEAAAAAKKEAEEALRKKIEAMTLAKNKAQDKANDLQDKLKREKERHEKELEAVKAGAGAESAETIRKLTAERDELNTKANEAEKKLAIADPGTAQFKVLFEEAQGLLNKLIALMAEAPEDKQAGLRKALTAMLEIYREKVREDAA